MFSNQLTQSVVRACGGGGRWQSAAWLGSAGVTKGLSIGGDCEGNGMGWHSDSCPRTGCGGEREEGDEGAVSGRGRKEEAYAGGGGSGPLVALSSTVFELRGGGNRAVLSVSHSD